MLTILLLKIKLEFENNYGFIKENKFDTTYGIISKRKLFIDYNTIK